MASVIDQIYDQINEVIGGSNPDQFFTLTLPGTILNPADYTESNDETDDETDDMIPKDPLLRKSELANGLFDVCQVTGGGGRGSTLPAQYEDALNQLITKPSPNIEELRTTLRDDFSVQSDTTLPDGTKFTGTKLELLTRLMDLYAKARKAWVTDQINMQQTLKKNYPTHVKGRRKAYFDWYEENAAQRKAEVQEAYDRTTMVLSQNELATIAGILDSGNIDIKKAKTALREALQDRPGGDAYDVMFTPSDWLTLLASEFGYIDLLESPEALAEQIQTQQGVIDEQFNQLDIMSDQIPTDATLQAGIQAATDAKSAYATAQGNLINACADSLATAAKIYLSKHQNNPTATADQKQADDVNALNKDIQNGHSATDNAKDATKTGGSSTALSAQDIDTLLGNFKAVNTAQMNLQSTSEEYATAALTSIGNQTEYADIKPLYQKLRTAAQQVAALQKKLNAASKVPDTTVQQIYPSAASERFTQLEIAFNSSQISDTSSLTSSFTQTSWSVDLFFGSASGQNSSGSSSFAHDVTSSDTSISIGMLLARVELDRTWFNSGVFRSTADMVRVATNPISHGPKQPADYAQCKSDVFATFPVAFVIAKDITIKFETQGSTTKQMGQELHKNASAGGGCLCFSVSQSSADDTENKSFSQYAQGTSIVMRIPGAQIIGWYQEFVPEDDSTPMTDADTKDFDSFLAQFDNARAKGPAAS